jgi:uncharacterized protein YuzE
MKLSYFPETDQLYIGLCDGKSVESEEVAPGIVLDFDGDGKVVGIDIEHASKALDLKTLEAHSLPIPA